MRNFAELNKEFIFATATTITRGMLTVDPIYQMREKMNHDVIEEYLACIDALPPMRAIKVGKDTILVDGFHRYFTYERADWRELPVLVVKGTEQEAMVYAMAANFEHLKSGSKPNKGDQQRAIRKVLPLAVKMSGFNSSAIKKNLKLLGIVAASRTIDYATEEARNELDQKAMSEAMRLRTEMPLRDIAEHLNMGKDKVSALITKALEQEDCLKNAIAQNRQAPSIQEIIDSTTIEDHPFDAAEFMGFDEDELREIPVFNPVEAKSRALADLEAGLSKDNRQAKTLMPKQRHINLLNEFATTWKQLHKDDVSKYLDESAKSPEFVKAILEAAELIKAADLEQA